MELQRRLLKGYSHKIPSNKEKDKKGGEEDPTEKAAANATPQINRQGTNRATNSKSVNKVDMRQLAM